MGSPQMSYNVKDLLEDDRLDLSMLQLDKVPLEEISSVKHKVRKLDLSNNQITSLQPSFASQLALLVELDLSKNKLTELPENFGSLSNLVVLDLYKNQIERLPLSFKQLSKLKFLDLKDNPLTPQLAKIAGPCISKGDCEKCARDVVIVMQEIHKSIQEDKKRIEEKEITKQKKKKKSKSNASANSNRTKSSETDKNVSLETPDPPASTNDTPASEITSVSANIALHHQQSSKFYQGCRFVYFIIRAFLWTLLLVGLFIGGLTVCNLPTVQPYTTSLVQYSKTIQDKVLIFTGDIPKSLSWAYDYVANVLIAFIAWFQHFVNDTLSRYAKTSKVYVLQAYDHIKNQAFHFVDKKKD